MNLTKLPSDAKKIAHYWYSSGEELAVFVTKRAFFVRDAKTGNFPVCPIRNIPNPHPAEGEEEMNYDYEVLGLYYRYKMIGTGLSGDC